MNDTRSALAQSTLARGGRMRLAVAGLPAVPRLLPPMQPTDADSLRLRLELAVLSPRWHWAVWRLGNLNLLIQSPPGPRRTTIIISGVSLKVSSSC
jgi:hypothetical protein